MRQLAAFTGESCRGGNELLLTDGWRAEVDFTLLADFGATASAATPGMCDVDGVSTSPFEADGARGGLYPFICIAMEGRSRLRTRVLLAHISSHGGFAEGGSDRMEEIDVSIEAGTLVELVLSLPREESRLRQLRNEVERALVEADLVAGAPLVGTHPAASEVLDLRLLDGVILLAQSSNSACRASDSTSCFTRHQGTAAASSDGERHRRALEGRLTAGGLV